MAKFPTNARIVQEVIIFKEVILVKEVIIVKKVKIVKEVKIVKKKKKFKKLLEAIAHDVSPVYMSCNVAIYHFFRKHYFCSPIVLLSPISQFLFTLSYSS